MSLPLALTPGEPAGIGPDLTVALAARSRPFDLVAIGSARLLEERARALGVPLCIHHDLHAPQPAIFV